MEITMEYLITEKKHINLPVKLDVILEQRIKEFMLSQRRQRWIELGE